MKVKIVMLMILGFMLMCSVGSAVTITDGLVAEYDFQEGVDSAILYDISGNGHNGTINGNPVWTSDGLVFDGTGDYVNIGDLGNLSDGFTIVTVAKTDLNNYQALISRVSSTANVEGKAGFYIGKYNSLNMWGTIIYHNTAPNYYTNAQAQAAMSGYTLISARYNSENNKLETITEDSTTNFDDRYQKILPAKMIDHTGNYHIGKLSYSTTGYSLNGTISYMVVYNRALSDTELSTIQHELRTETESRGIELPHKATPYVALTLDDGGTTDYDNAIRIANKYNIPITMYVVPQKVGKNGFMTWTQINNLRDRGHGIEDHTLNHDHLKDFTEEQLRANLDAVDAGFISGGLPIPEHISYPFGNITHLYNRLYQNIEKQVDVLMYLLQRV